jgi:hypothetical protein
VLAWREQEERVRVKAFDAEVHRIILEPGGASVVARSRAVEHVRVDVENGSCTPAVPDDGEYWVVPRALETEVQRARDDAVVASFPMPIRRLRSSPRGDVWVAGKGTHLFAFRLER